MGSFDIMSLCDYSGRIAVCISMTIFLLLTGNTIMGKKIFIHFCEFREFPTDSLRTCLAAIVYEYSIYLTTFIEYYVLSDETFSIKKHNV